MPDALHLILPANLDSVIVQMIGAYVISSGVGGFAAGVVVSAVWRWATRRPL